MFSRALLRTLLVLLAVALVGVIGASPAMGYGRANWQIAFAGTGTQPTVGGFGFWGWCDFGGGTSFNAAGQATAGTTGDCEYSVYVHVPGVSGATCEESADLTGWYIGGNGDFFFSGTATVHPASLTAFCFAFPGSTGASSFSDVDSLLPAVAGHLNLNGVIPGINELQLQANPIP